MKILILGGTGTMGLPLSMLLAKDNNVTVLCHKTKNVKNVKYILGDFSDEKIRKTISSTTWDCIVDMLWHNEEKFKKTFEFLINITKHYINFSSAAVYANYDRAIKENDLRFLDEKYSDENYYHLSKARMENVIINSKYNNWTIVRPHVTFNSNRLPLDTWEMDMWLNRYLEGKTIVLTEEMLSKKTSFTYGYDVAKLIRFIVVNAEKTFKEIYNVSGDKCYTWGEIVDLISNELKNMSRGGLKLKIYKSGDKYYDFIKYLPHKADRLKYDRLLNRYLDNSKVKQLSDEEVKFEDLNTSISKCLMDKNIDYLKKTKYEDSISLAFMDYVSNEKTSLKRIAGKKNKIKYLFLRYFINYDIALSIYKFISHK